MSEKLRSKGWSDEEIDKTKQILLRAEEKKHPRLIKLERALYWIILLIIFVGGAGVAWLMEPLLYTSTPTQAGIFVAVFGLLFGTLASILIKDIEELELHHHILVSISMPIAAIIASVFVASRASKLAQLPEFAIQHHPVLLGGIYAIFALAPYIIFISTQRRKHGA